MKQCKAIVKVAMRGRRCMLSEKDGMDGYCALHYPANVEARRAAQNAKYDAVAEKCESELAARAEELRKLAVFGDMLVALKAASAIFEPNHVISRLRNPLFMTGEDYMELNELSGTIKAAIAKAEGHNA